MQMMQSLRVMICAHLGTYSDKSADAAQLSLQVCECARTFPESISSDAHRAAVHFYFGIICEFVRRSPTLMLSIATWRIEPLWTNRRSLCGTIVYCGSSFFIILVTVAVV